MKEKKDRAALWRRQLQTEFSGSLTPGLEGAFRSEPHAERGAREARLPEKAAERPGGAGRSAPTE